MKKFGVGSHVRYIGGQPEYDNPLLLALIGRTGVIRSKSDRADADWFVEMDSGCLDLDAVSAVLEIVDGDCDPGGLMASTGDNLATMKLA